MIYLKAKVVNKKPQWWFIIKFIWHVDWEDNRFEAFTWGDTIYAPKRLSKPTLAHEVTHVRQQHASKVYGLFCLIRYKLDRKYRRAMENQAGRAEYKSGGNLAVILKRLDDPFYL